MAIRNFEVNCIFFSTMCYGSFFSWGIWCYGRQGMGYCDRFYFFCIVLCMNTNIFSTLPLDVENIGIYTQNIKDASSQTMRSLLTFASLRQSARAFHAQCSLFSGAESSLPSLRSDNPHALKTHNLWLRSIASCLRFAQTIRTRIPCAMLISKKQSH